MNEPTIDVREAEALMAVAFNAFYDTLDEPASGNTRRVWSAHLLAETGRLYVSASVDAIGPRISDRLNKQDINRLFDATVDAYKAAEVGSKKRGVMIDLLGYLNAAWLTLDRKETK